MEKFYIVKNEKYLTALNDYKNACNKQGEFVANFFKENNIDGDKYYMGGDGCMNCAFDEHDKKSIMLYIWPSLENKHVFNKQLLTKPHKTGLIGFRKTSKLLKNFQDQCVENDIPINLWKPRISHYITNELIYQCTSQVFNHNGDVYLILESDQLKDKTSIADDFIEIKGSEFYKAKEEYEVKYE